MNLETKNITELAVENIREKVAGQYAFKAETPAQAVEYAFASDLMSDVLTLDSNNVMLITGLANPQVIRTAEMSDISLVVIARGKKCSSEMIELARDCQITLIESPYSLFRICGNLFHEGIKPIF